MERRIRSIVGDNPALYRALNEIRHESELAAELIGKGVSPDTVIQRFRVAAMNYEQTLLVIGNSKLQEVSER